MAISLRVFMVKNRMQHHFREMVRCVRKIAGSIWVLKEIVPDTEGVLIKKKVMIIKVF